MKQLKFCPAFHTKLLYTFTALEIRHEMFFCFLIIGLYNYIYLTGTFHALLAFSFNLANANAIKKKRYTVFLSMKSKIC